MNGLPSIVDPELKDVLNQHKDEIFASFNCHLLGTIVSFDAARQTASISVNFQRSVFNKQVAADALSNQATPTTPNVISFPVLVQCPVMVYSGGGGYLSMPIGAGDTCLVLFHDRDIDSWYASGATTTPNSNRMHSLSDGLAIVGFRSLANAISGYSTTNAVWNLPTAGKFVISNNATSLRAAMDAHFSVLVNWANGSYPNTAALVTALNASKSTFQSLLA